MRFCGNGQESSLSLWIIYFCSLQVFNICGTIHKCGAGVNVTVTAIISIQLALECSKIVSTTHQPPLLPNRHP